MISARTKIFIGILTLIIGGFGYWVAPSSEDAVGGEKPLFDPQGVQVYTDCDLTAPKRQNIANDLKNLKARNPDNSLRALDARDRASLKGCEIAKVKTVPKTRVQFSGADYEIEIVEMNPIDGGVEVFARAWTPQGQQIGFSDGSVDLERFRIFNPPILVQDSLGPIVRDEVSPLTGLRTVTTYREDPTRALLQDLAHTISIKKERFVGSQIQPGKRGNTTTTVYPDANPETTTVDGLAYDNTATASWSTMRGAAGDAAADTSASETFAGWDAGAASYSYLVRSIFLFSTSAIGTDTISSATLSLYGSLKSDTGGQAIDINIYASTPASNTGLVAGDYAQTGTTAFATAISYASYSTTGYNDFSFNATGIAAINGSGVSKFAARNANKDVANSAPTLNTGFTGFQGYYADQAGTTNDPKLVVEHTASAVSTSAEDIIYY